MQLLPIDIDETKNSIFKNTPACADILNVYPGFYEKIGYYKPWIGYFATIDGYEIVGGGGFKGKPKDGKVEIAYVTFQNFEGKGIGTEICRQLVLLSLQTDPAIRVTARTILETNPSAKILKRNGFECNGIVYDEDEGDVWEWEFKSKTPGNLSQAI